MQTPHLLTDFNLVPTASRTVKEELRHLQVLMQIEQKEDAAQFKLKNAKATIKERRKRGLTWYPVTITSEEIGFGGKVVLELERPADRQDLHLFQVGANACLFGNLPGYADADRPTLSGVITEVRHNKLLLATSKEDLPDWVINGVKLGGDTPDGSKLGVDLTFDEVSLNALVAADRVLVPLHCEYFALEGLADLVGTMRRVRASLNPSLDIEGVLLTMNDERTNLGQQVARDVREFFKEKVYQTVIPRNVRVAEAPSHGLPAVTYDAKSRGSEAYFSFANELIEKNNEERMTNNEEPVSTNES